MLGRKQRIDNEQFLHTWRNIRNIVSKVELDRKIASTLERIRKTVEGHTVGIAWSGGKDSVVVDFLMKKVGRFPSCLGMTHDLEYPAFLQYVTNNMPDDLVVYNSGHSLEWLSTHQEWLFPDTKRASQWFKAVQHSAQNKFWHDRKLTLLVTGRRKIDGNYCGVDGIYRNKTTGIVRFSPIYDWTHEEVLACMEYYVLPFAPCYSWPNGFVVGSGSWAARQYCTDHQEGWSQLAQIDIGIVVRAANKIESAKQYLKNVRSVRV